MNNYFDSFISYGRADSKAFATQLHKRLTELGLKVWFDQNNIPPAVDWQNQIDDGIDNAHNFIFVISPHSINSEYCLKELLAAIKSNKRIIPLLHVQSPLDKMQPILRQLNWIYFQEDIDNFEEAFEKLIYTINHQADYIEQHTRFLVKALEWERHQKQTSYLLIGSERIQAESWLKVQFRDEQPPCEPSDLHCEFIGESTKNANNLMTQVFISYAEADKEIQEKIGKTIRRQGFTIWTQDLDVKTGIDFQEAINQGIEEADNIVYLLSPNSLRSLSSQKELDYAFTLNKRLLSILIEDTELEKASAKLQALQFIDFTKHEDEEQYHQSAAKLLNELKQDALYYKESKILLAKALKWQRQNRNRSILLRGHNLEHYQAWLKVAKQRAEHRPLPLQEEFIVESANQPPESSLEVFISYSRADSDFARQLNEALQLQGKTTWFDQESIPPGSDFKQEIYRGIESSDNFLFIISPNSVYSPYCADEVEYATKLNKRFVTVLHSDVPAQDLHPELCRIQWIDFNRYGGDFCANFSELVRALDTDRNHVKSHSKWSLRALEWEEKGKSGDLLLRGSEFAIAQNWLQEAQQHHKQPPATPLQKALIEASQDAIVAAQEEEKRWQAEMLRLQEERTKEAEARLAEQKKSARRLRLFLGSVSGALVLSIMLGIATFRGYRTSAISEVKAFSTSSEALFASNQQLEALIAAIRAGQQLKKLGGVKQDIQTLAIEALLHSLGRIKEYNRLEGHRAGVDAVSFSPDGSTIATVDLEGTVKLWKTDGTLLNIPWLKNLKVSAVAFRPYTQIIATASEDIVTLWNLDGQQLRTLAGHRGTVQAVAFSPDGKMMATASTEVTETQEKVGTVQLWNPDNGTLLKTWKAHGNVMMVICFSPDGQMIASTSWEHEVKLWNRDGKLLKTLEGHSDAVTAVSFSPDGSKLATASVDKTVNLWKRDGTGGFETRSYKTLSGYGDAVWGVVWRPDSQLIATATGDKPLNLWRPDGTLVKTLAGHSDVVRAVAFSSDGKMIASASDDRTVKLWKLGDTPLLALEHSSPVYAVGFSPNGKNIATTNGHGFVTFWQRDGLLLKTEKWQGGPISKLDFSHNGEMIVTASGDRSVQLRKSDGTLLKYLQGHTGELDQSEVLGVSFSPDSQMIATGDVKGAVQLWNTDGKLLKTLQEHGDMVVDVSFSPDGQIIAAASRDRTVKLWKPDGTLLTTFKGHEGAVIAVAFSPNSQMIATASVDKTVKLWKRDGTLYKTLKGHKGVVKAVTFSPDGKTIASASVDKTVKLWKQDGTFLRTLKAHCDVVRAIAFSLDGHTLASASQDGTVMLWNLDRVLDLDGLLLYGCDWARNYLKNNFEVEKSDRTLCDGIGTRK